MAGSDDRASRDASVLLDTPRRVLAVYAHPDDTEVACGGALAAWATAGADVHLVICTTGEKGRTEAGVDPERLAEVRADEVRQAASVLGVADHEVLGHRDGEIENTVELRRFLVERIREVRPDIVLGHDPTAIFFGSGYVSHHDHRTVGWAVLDACAPMAGSPLYFPEAGAPHPVARLLLSGTLDPDVWVDIEGHLDTKIEALRCHRSQVGDADDDVFERVVRQRAEEAGRAGGLRYAEGFRLLRLA